MNCLKQTSLLFLAAKRNVVQHTSRRGFLYSWKKGFNRDTQVWLQQPIDLSWSAIVRWLKRKRWEALVHDQRFIPERHLTLGPDLATAHFVVARGGSIKFEGMDRWVRKNVAGKYFLPSSAQANIRLEAVDVSGVEVTYTSFDNFVNLEHLKYLNVSKCPHFDDWCLDRFVQFRDSLLVLDLSGCPQVTEKGLATLHKLPKLKRLFLHNMPNVKDQPLVAIMLEEALPNCVIEGISYTSEDALTGRMSANQPPAFLHQWFEFAHKEEQERMLTAEKDGILDIVNMGQEKIKGKTGP